MKKEFVISLVLIAAVFILGYSGLILHPESPVTGNAIGDFLSSGLQSGLVSYWSFDSADGSNATIAKDIVGGNNGTALNRAYWNSSGKRNEDYTFDGTNDAIKMLKTDSLNILGNITISFWVKPSANRQQAFVHKNEHYSISVDASGALSWADSTNWNYANFGFYGNVPIGQWSFITATKSGRNVTIYKNGVIVVSKSFGTSGVTRNAASTLFFGCYSYDAACSSKYTKGEIDEVGVWNRALNSTEVYLLYASYSGSSCTPNCAGKSCGDDGCGGSCGTCVSGQTCTDGDCIDSSPPACTQSSWNCTLNPVDCPANGRQNKTCSNITACSGGIIYNASEIITCTPRVVGSTCTEDDWSAVNITPALCPDSARQNVTWIKTFNCSGGVEHNTTELKICRQCGSIDWNSTVQPASCPSTGKQNVTWMRSSSNFCSGGVTHPAFEMINCTPGGAPTCLSFTYSEWSECASDRTQTREVISSLPAGCAGGSPETMQACTPETIITTDLDNEGKDATGSSKVIKTIIILILVVIAVALAGVLGFWWYRKNKAEKAHSSSRPAPSQNNYFSPKPPMNPGQINGFPRRLI